MHPPATARRAAPDPPAVPAGDAPAADHLAQWDREHVWHAFTQMRDYEPLLIERGEGAWLVDTAGRRYLDGSASMWCNVHGHRHPRLDAALAAQAAKVAHTTNLGLSNPTTVEFARRLVEIAPPGLEKVFFTGDGSSAIEAALKMAFQYWLQADPPQPARKRFIAIGEAYHGDTLGAIGVGGVDRFTALFAPLTFEALRLPSPGGPCPATGRPAPSLADSLAALDRLLADHAGTVAALVMEPLVQAAAVGLESLNVFRDERVLESLPPKIARLREHAARLGRLDHVGAVRQCGLVAGIELVADAATGRPYPWAERRGARACAEARKHGALLRQLGDVVVLMPPLSISLAELDGLAAAAEAGIRAATREPA
jgi:adenosylmethionine-8-amino-7-oxononanoate aminotransferase